MAIFIFRSFFSCCKEELDRHRGLLGVIGRPHKSTFYSDFFKFLQKRRIFDAGGAGELICCFYCWTFGNKNDSSQNYRYFVILIFERKFKRDSKKCF